MTATAALKTGSPYAQLGRAGPRPSRPSPEPAVLFVAFSVTLLTDTDLPYALAAMVRSSTGQIIRSAC